jgi:Tfp pilus assembly protein PilN
MPAELKEQIRFAKMNRLALRYLRVLGATALILAGIFVGAGYIILSQADVVAKDVASKQADINGKKKTLLPKAKDASERLNAIKYIQDTQTKFSLLIADLVKVLPQNVKIQSVALTGNDKAAVSIAVTSKSYDGVLALRNALVTSPRVSGADIVSISGKDDSWQGSVVISFNPGKAK